MDFGRNNLDRGASPYLQQHRDNPINWQEWREEVLEYAREEGRFIFLSVGYSTCHWCHAMAGETFEDRETADYLNKYFVSIKVDREQRPDIDGYFMDFMVRTRGHGGWPLNVILKPDLSPIYAFTYAPVKRKYGTPGLLDILRKVREIGGDLEYIEEEPEESGEERVSLDYIMEVFTSYFDYAHGGFGDQEKFPPHSSLLFLLTYHEMTGDEGVLPLIEKTLAGITRGGLQDHLQGGFFRYCVDREWRIPHFEKMLYDQALLLWVLSDAYRILGNEEYLLAADGIIEALEETFQEGKLYHTALDADTSHREGGTYLWTLEELRGLLSPEELEMLSEVYEIEPGGNFQGRIHLIRKSHDTVRQIERRLLEARRKRGQPFVDKKILTSWNAMTGIGYLMHWRATGNKVSCHRAREIAEELLANHYRDGRLLSSSLEGAAQEGEFLRDYAWMLLLITHLQEEEGGYMELMRELKERVESFREEKWIESRNPDFYQVEARPYDLGIPSSISAAELALVRCAVLSGEEPPVLDFRSPLDCDLHNMAVLIAEEKINKGP